MRSLRTLSRRLWPAGFAILGLALIGAAGGQASDPFRAGGLSTRPVATNAGDLDGAVARGRDVARALGLPAATGRAVRLDDLFDHRQYDEVTTLDAAGREIAVVRIGRDGTVGMAVALGWNHRAGRAIDASTATTHAQGFARAVGIALADRPDVRPSAGAGGWSVAWPRVVGGVPVRGDGVRVLVWPDGTFHGLTRSERPLAAAPARQLTATEARAAAARVVAARLGAGAEVRVVGTEQAWVAPNDLFDPAAADAPAATLRLAWIVRFDAHGATAERVRAIEIWLDAGDGRLLGGDSAT